MFRVESTVLIQKSVEEVYTFVNNPDSITRWQAGVEAVKYPDGTPKVGTQYTEVRRFMGKRMDTTLEVTILETNKRYGAKVIKGPVHFELEVSFTAEGKGTRMTTVVSGEPGGFLKIAESMVVKQLEQTLAEDGQHLKSLLEGY